MILDKCSIVLIPPLDISDARPKQLELGQDSDFHWLLQEAVRLFSLNGARVDFLIRQGSAEILLSQLNFTDFKRTAHLNKIVRVV